MMWPQFQQWRKEGESGRRKITKATRYLTLGIAFIQGTSLAVTLGNQGLAFDPGPSFLFVAALTMVTGSIFMMWLEQITERGVGGNGISLLIFSGIVSGFPAAIGQMFEAARLGNINIIALLAMAALAVGVVWFVVRVERSQRHIAVNYAKRQQGLPSYDAGAKQPSTSEDQYGEALFRRSSHPACFWPGIHGQLVWVQSRYGRAAASGLGSIPRTAALHHDVRSRHHIFSFFYTAIMFDPKDVADNLKRRGAYVPVSGLELKPRNTSTMSSRALRYSARLM